MLRQEGCHKFSDILGHRVRLYLQNNKQKKIHLPLFLLIWGLFAAALVPSNLPSPKNAKRNIQKVNYSYLQARGPNKEIM